MCATVGSASAVAEIVTMRRTGAVAAYCVVSCDAALADDIRDRVALEAA